jgi:predicted kinase
MTSPKAIIMPIMGACYTGTTTLLAKCKQEEPSLFGLVEVGKLLRAKYGEDHFKGQAAPDHTEQEAWDLGEREMNARIREGHKVILVDGQPRRINQFQKMVNYVAAHEYPIIYTVLYAPLDERKERAIKRDGGDEARTRLGNARLTDDMVKQHDLLLMMMSSGYVAELNVYDTTHMGWDQEFLDRVFESLALLKVH